jgi:hypothetical protein
MLLAPIGVEPHASTLWPEPVQAPPSAQGLAGFRSELAPYSLNLTDRSENVGRIRLLEQTLFKLRALTLCAILGLALVAEPALAHETLAHENPPLAQGPHMRVSVVQGDGLLCPGKPCSRWIAAEGTVSWSAIGDFAAALSAFGTEKPVVAINSRGGLVEPALAIGRMLRMAGATVIVGHTIFPYRGPHFAATGEMDPAAQKFGGLCQSACVFILAGGVKRLVPTGGFVAVHRPANFTREIFDARPARLVKKPIDDADALVERLKAYFAEMGVGAPVLDLMLATPPAHMRFLSVQELLNNKLAAD